MEKSNKKIMLLICIALVFVISIAVAVCIFMTNPSKDNNTSEGINTNVGSIVDTSTNTDVGSGTNKPSCDHTPKIIPAKAPTCISTGLTEGKKCLACGEILVAQKEIPISQTHIYENAYVCSFCNQEVKASEGLEYILRDGEDEIYYAVDGIGTCTDTKIVIPREYNGFPVTTIYDGFRGCDSITSMVIPNTITTISGSAFLWCDSFTIYCEAKSQPEGWNRMNMGGEWNGGFGGSVVWNCNKNDVATDGYTYTVVDGIRYAIKDDEAMVARNPGSIKVAKIKSSINYEDENYNVTYIDRRAFYTSRSISCLTEISLPSSITSIGEYAFAKCSNLTSIEISDGVTSIGEYAFNECTSLTRVTIPNSVTIVDGAAFANCTSLKSITLGNNIIKINGGAFINCTSLTSIVIPNSVKSIGASAFDKCTSLTNIFIPKDVAFVYESAFGNCQNLKIYCGATSQPSNWEAYWNLSNCPVEWGHVHSYTNGECVCGTKQN